MHKKTESADSRHGYHVKNSFRKWWKEAEVGFVKAMTADNANIASLFYGIYRAGWKAHRAHIRTTNQKVS